MVALCFLVGVIGYWIGQPDDAEPFSDVDVGFLADMTAHHQSAIDMSLAYLNRGADPTVEHFARDILLSQTQEIAVMNSLLVDAGTPASVGDDVAMDWMGMAVPPSAMPGIPTSAEQAALAAAQGTAADDLFTALMIRHHAAGAAMAEFAAEHGSNSKVRNLAAAMAKVQRTEINEMNTRRVALGLPAVDVSAVEQEMAGSHAH
ncbi:MAG TPA: DUF305 domain-containing protein [Acidimicrobiia bacterium]|nr:DUF305 domain-containing protein [Acidimicrobiia bacterium]